MIGDCRLVENPEFRQLWETGNAEWFVTHGEEPKILTSKGSASIQELRNRLADYIGLQ